MSRFVVAVRAVVLISFFGIPTVASAQIAPPCCQASHDPDDEHEHEHEHKHPITTPSPIAARARVQTFQSGWPTDYEILLCILLAGGVLSVRYIIRSIRTLPARPIGDAPKRRNDDSNDDEGERKKAA